MDETRYTATVIVGFFSFVIEQKKETTFSQNSYIFVNIFHRNEKERQKEAK